jgi:hypothetical protein|tara:strand:- start:18688 stop:19005 length:318 start_codon:yes stop_codon:yes gene_type:complete
MIKKKFNEFLFWLHAVVILAGTLLGLFVSMVTVYWAILIHRIHIIIFGGCILSKFQKKLGGIPKDISFLQYAIYRFSGNMISRRQERFFDYSLVSCCFILAVLFG